MSETGEAKAKKDALASGAKPRPEGRDRERGWRPTCEGRGYSGELTEAARRRAIERVRRAAGRWPAARMEDA